MNKMNSCFSDNKSILLTITKPFFSRFLSFLPPTLKPNTITITGFIAVLANYIFIHLGIKGYSSGYLFGSFALLLYLFADNIDGMHARLTNQTSKLGGFLDQWIDGISLPLIALPILYTLHVKGYTLSFLLCLLTLSCFFLYVEQHIYGVFYKPTFGPNEFLLMVIIGYIIIYFSIGSNQLLYIPGKINIASGFIVITIFLSVTFVVRGILVLGLQLKNYIGCFAWYLLVVFYGILRKNITSLDFEIFYILTHSIIMGYLITAFYGSNTTLLRSLNKQPFDIKEPIK